MVELSVTDCRRLYYFLDDMRKREERKNVIIEIQRLQEKLVVIQPDIFEWGTKRYLRDLNVRVKDLHLRSKPKRS